MPNWISHSKNSPEYRFIAVREPLNEQPLPGMEAQLELPFPAMRLSNGGMAQGLWSGDQPGPSGG